MSVRFCSQLQQPPSSATMKTMIGFPFLLFLILPFSLLCFHPLEIFSFFSYMRKCGYFKQKKHTHLIVKLHILVGRSNSICSYFLTRNLKSRLVCMACGTKEGKRKSRNCPHEKFFPDIILCFVRPPFFPLNMIFFGLSQGRLFTSRPCQEIPVYC